MARIARPGLVVLSLALASCANDPEVPMTIIDPALVPGGMNAEIAGRSVEGRPIHARSWGRGPARVLVIASIHGDEPAGTPLVQSLEDHLHRLPHAPLADRVTVTIVPVANPDGYEHRRRYNSRGVDLNRNFPAANWTARDRNGAAPLSEPESRALDDLIRDFRPHRIVSIHQPLGCIDYDGPAEARTLALAMSRAGSLPVRRLGGRPGSLGSCAGATLGIPTITLELPGGLHRMDPDALWDRYGPMLLVAVTFEG